MGEIFTVDTQQPRQAIDVTAQVMGIVESAGVESGLCHVMAMHSTAAVVVNETHDPNIGIDVIHALDRAIPERAGWLHDRVDDNAHAHIKAAILGPSEVIPVSRGALLLGTWQRIMLIELDGPRKRRISVQLLAPSVSRPPAA
jgi:secondary thiamine-phosphate synthase enzyme